MEISQIVSVALTAILFIFLGCCWIGTTLEKSKREIRDPYKDPVFLYFYFFQEDPSSYVFPVTDHVLSVTGKPVESHDELFLVILTGQKASFHLKIIIMGSTM